MILWTSNEPANKMRTKTHDNGGSSATWNDSFSVNFTRQEHATEFLFIEVWNSNTLVPDYLIGKTKFSTSGISDQPVEAWVKVFRENGDNAGEVLLVCQCTNHHAQQSQQAATAVPGRPPSNQFAVPGPPSNPYIAPAVPMVQPIQPQPQPQFQPPPQQEPVPVVAVAVPVPAMIPTAVVVDMGTTTTTHLTHMSKPTHLIHTTTTTHLIHVTKPTQPCLNPALP